MSSTDFLIYVDVDAVWLSDQLAVLRFGAYPAQLLS